MEEIRVENKIRTVRILSITALVISVLSILPGFLFDLGEEEDSQEPFIARIKIDGFITDDTQLYSLIDKAGNDEQVKAVIFWISSPGGVGAGGEQLYRDIKALSGKKPTIALIRSIGTSAAYMAALGADQILALESSIIGSVGAMVQSFDAVDLVKDLGINPITLKSGKFKGGISPFEKANPEQLKLIQSMLDEFNESFQLLVKNERKIEDSTMKKIYDGRVFNGLQAVKLRLIDQIGSETEAVEYLARAKNIKGIPVREYEDKSDEEKLIAAFLGESIRNFFYENIISNLNFYKLLGINH